MIRRLIALFRRQPAPLDAMLARRSQRVSNRDRATAQAYERVHQVLANGPKK